jgi:hypothetical protein
LRLDLRQGGMDTLRRAEVLLYLVLIAPRRYMLEDAEGLLREWSILALQRFAQDWSEEDRSDIAEQFALLVPRLRRTLGMTFAGDNTLHFQNRLDFTVRPDYSVGDMLAERRRLLSELQRLDRRLVEATEASYPVALPTYRVAFPGTERAIRGTPPYADVIAFLSEPGPNALDSETFARLLSRDTGA